jgi:kinetochore protein Mis13/DSN1
LLDEEEAKMLSALTDPSSTFSSIRKQTKSRLQTVQSSLEYKADHLADVVHKLDQRVMAAGREADRVLGLSSTRLKEREEKEKTSVGTKDLPAMEVLRSLSRILPESGG